MEERDKEKLRRNLVRLTEEVDIPGVLPFLQQEGILREDHAEIIRESKTSRRKREVLVTILKTQGPAAFSCFCFALERVGQTHLANLLRADTTEEPPESADLEADCCPAVRYLKLNYYTEVEIMRKHWKKLMAPCSGDLQMDQMYVDLEVVEEDKAEKPPVLTWKQLLGSRNNKKILLEGEPGMGKTTYLHKIVKDWIDGHEWLNEQFKLVLLVRLGDLTKNDTLLTHLSRAVGVKYANCLMQYMKHKENQQHVLLVLDGFDELNKDCTAIKELINSKMIGADPVHNATMIVSSRISHSSQEDVKENDLLVRTNGFSVEKVRESLSGIPNLDSLNELHDQSSLCRTPLFVGMIASIGHVPDELCDLMHEYCQMLVERYIQFRDPTLDVQESWEKVKNYLGKLAFLSLRPVGTDSYIFLCYLRKTEYNEEKLAQCYHECHAAVEANPSVRDLCKKIGFIQSKEKMSKGQGSSDPSFPHQLFMEFFAAFCLSDSENDWMLNDMVITHKICMTTPFYYFACSLSEKFKQTVLDQFYEVDSESLFVHCPWMKAADLITAADKCVTVIKDNSSSRFRLCVNGQSAPNHLALLKRILSQSAQKITECEIIRTEFDLASLKEACENLSTVSLLEFSNCHLLKHCVDLSMVIDRWQRFVNLEYLDITVCDASLAYTILEQVAFGQSTLHHLSLYSAFPPPPYHKTFTDAVTTLIRNLKYLNICAYGKSDECCRMFLNEISLSNRLEEFLLEGPLPLQTSKNFLKLLELFEALPPTIRRLCLRRESVTPGSIGALVSFRRAVRNLETLPC